MKFIILLAVSLYSFSLVHAQKEFEGRIRYKASPEKENNDNNTPANDSMEINIWFTKGKILIRNITEPDKDDILIWIDSANVYTLNKQDKSYSVKKLYSRKEKAVPVNLTIAGYRCTPLQNSGSGYAFGAAVRTTIWYADSLLFILPEKYEGNDELLMIRNGHIMLKTEIYTDFNPGREPENNTDNEEEDNTITITAIDVIPGQTDPADFSIPEGFTKYDSRVSVDSVSVTKTKAEPSPPPPPPPVKKVPAKPQPAAPKGVKSSKQTIRKEN